MILDFYQNSLPKGAGCLTVWMCRLRPLRLAGRLSAARAEFHIRVERLTAVRAERRLLRLAGRLLGFLRLLLRLCVCLLLRLLLDVIRPLLGVGLLRLSVRLLRLSVRLLRLSVRLTVRLSVRLLINARHAAVLRAAEAEDQHENTGQKDQPDGKPVVLAEGAGKPDIRLDGEDDVVQRDQQEQEANAAAPCDFIEDI